MPLSISTNYLASDAMRKAILANNILVKDNSEVVAKWIPEKIPPIKPTKNIIHSQSPEPGTYIPTGSTVDVSVIAKETIPLDSFDLNSTILGKYGGLKIKDFLQDTEDKPGVMAVLGGGKTYETLTGGEKNEVDNYLTATFGVKPSGSEEEKQVAKKTYNDAKFLFNL